MATHPRTAERRQVRRCLQLDLPPPAMLERVGAARVAGQTWIQIEHESAQWKEWDEVPEEVSNCLPLSWKLETRNWKLGLIPGWKLETGNWRLRTGN